MLMALVALAAGLWAGLLRLGYAAPPLPGGVVLAHGPLMAGGFLGTVISLERAVALGQNQGGRRRYYAAPLLSGLAGLLLLTAVPAFIPRFLFVLASLGLVGIFVVIYRMQPGADHAVMGLAAGMWLAGNVLWLAGRPLALVVVWWAGFLVLTIAGERLELARVLLLAPRARRTFSAVVGLFTAGLVVSLVWPDAGVRLAGVGLAALGVWLLRFDIARRTIRREGLTRFIAACLLPGYVWLIVGGALWMANGATAGSGPAYDMMLHVVFLGFVMSMIFGHAPVIIPAVMGIPIRYTPWFYGHLALLHGSLALRIAGDMLGNAALRRWGGLLNEVAVVAFLVVTALAARRGESGGAGADGRM